ncbi:MAG: sugar-binding domain-containing protein [Candidatus Firestonebacteria bacterium]
MQAKKDLNGMWQFSLAEKNNWNIAKVPGCVQMDLMALEKLPDPFYRMNERQFIDIEPCEWDYKKEFVVADLSAKKQLNNAQINLVFEGLDTFCNIYLNDKYIGRAENMFIPHIFDITDILKEGNNVLFVHFDSPIKTIKVMEGNSPYVMKSVVETARPYIRKAQYSYGWDWGPRIAQTGIWRNVYLEFIDIAKLENPFFYTEKISDNTAYVHISCEVTGNTDEDFKIETIINYKGKKIVSFKNDVKNIKGKFGINEKVEIKNPKLWYPNNMGEQNLYELKFLLYCKGEKIDTLKIASGIRIVKLLQEEDKDGKSFIFEINGIKTFCKGANWIPADNFIPRITKKDYYDLIKMAKDANMNMLRVWGGGIYEDSAFYSACDEMGIMVWQDFMYACAQYPDQFDWFQKLAKEEAVCIVKKLRNHPSIVIWCGNNENNWGNIIWWGCGDPKFFGNYIYKEILPEVCRENDFSRPYWVSSPYGGEDPNSEKEGDRHSYEVWGKWKDYEVYTKDEGRFISEFAFQSMPNWKTVISFTERKDRRILSQVMLSHNKKPEGVERTIKYLIARVGLPKDFKSFVYLTQFNQAEAIKTGVEHWRNNKFHTSGTLYWQFNDCWPGASWSCIDYYKRKKALWYYSKKFFDNILPYLKFIDNAVSLTIINDFNEAKKAKVFLKVFEFNGRKLFEKKFDINLLANDVSKVYNIKIAEFIKEEEKCLMVKDIKEESSIPEYVNKKLLNSVIFVDVIVGDKVYGNYLVFDRFRNLDIPKAKINLIQKGNILNVIADKPVFGLFIESENDVDISDNCLILEPVRNYEIKFSDNPGKIELFNLENMITEI